MNANKYLENNTHISALLSQCLKAYRYYYCCCYSCNYSRTCKKNFKASGPKAPEPRYLYFCKFQAKCLAKFESSKSGNLGSETVRPTIKQFEIYCLRRHLCEDKVEGNNE